MTTKDNNNTIIGFMAETFIHSGCGQSQGAIDLPFSREKATDYPYIPGSSLKGAFKDYARAISGWEDVEKKDENGNTIYKKDNNKQETKIAETKIHPEINQIFGKSDNAGNLLVSDLRLLLLPVRSLTSAYKWVTCPHILQRLKRDLQRAGKSDEFSIKVTYKKTDNDASLFLEELSFKKTNETIDDELLKILKSLCNIIEDKDKIIIIDNDDFHWFAKNALSIQARNVLNDNKASENLWYEENLPPDTLMYCLLSNRKTSDSVVGTMLEQIKTEKYLQTGGNETVGMGWFQMQKYGGVNNADD